MYSTVWAQHEDFALVEIPGVFEGIITSLEGSNVAGAHRNGR
jgi:hypothetical protein